MPIIAQYLKDKDNNFNLLRFIAASTVVYQHCYPLLGFADGNSYFANIVNAVAIFFVISGFLISKSWDESKNLVNFGKKRFYRIVPGLFICLIFTIMIIGPLCTNLSLSEYFSQKQTYRYVLKNISFNTAFRINGLFESNPYPQAVNGSLWTLELEVFCYIMVAVFGVFLAKIKINLAKFLILITATLIILLKLVENNQNQDSQSLILQYLPEICKHPSYVEMSIYFAIGSLYYHYRQRLKIIPIIAIAILPIYLLNQQFYLNKYLNFAILPYLVFYFALAIKPTNPKLANFGKTHDLSYGIYIYAFPIQQAVIYFLLTSQIIKPFLSNFAPELVKINLASEQNFNIILFAFLFFISYSVSLIFAFLSFKYVEKPCLGIYKT